MWSAVSIKGFLPHETTTSAKFRMFIETEVIRNGNNREKTIMSMLYLQILNYIYTAKKELRKTDFKF